MIGLLVVFHCTTLRELNFRLQQKSYKQELTVNLNPGAFRVAGNLPLFVRLYLNWASECLIISREGCTENTETHKIVAQKFKSFSSACLGFS